MEGVSLHDVLITFTLQDMNAFERFVVLTNVILIGIPFVLEERLTSELLQIFIKSFLFALLKPHHGLSLCIETGSSLAVASLFHAFSLFLWWV